MIDAFEHGTDENVNCFQAKGLRVLSDLHVYGPEDPLYRRLIQWLRDTPRDVTVALLGDIFDVWVGESAYFKDRYAEFFGELTQLGDHGSSVIYIEGNHDFLMRDVFVGAGRTQLIDSECEVRINNQRVYLGHGDLANSEDTGYLRLRGFFRSPVFRAAVQIAPGVLVAQVGARMSRYSRARNTPVQDKRSAVEIDAMRSIYRNFATEKFREGYDHVLLGHCHDDDTFEITLEGRACSYLNVGFPRKHRCFIEFDSETKAFVRRPF